jgi:uncharacterized membrane protein affecting hemolysin expression
MKRIIYIVVGIAVLGAVAFGAVMMVTSADRNLAKQFVVDLSSGAHEQATAVMHEELIKEFSLEKMQEAFQNVKPYAEVSFSSIKASGGRTSLEGVAKTADGCESIVEITLLNDLIVSFNISPLCQKS